MDLSKFKLDTEEEKKEIEGELIECPNCKHHFDSAETFQWLADELGHPIIEYLSCPRCNVATEPIFSCSMCPSENKCTLEEECGATLHYNYDDWKVVDNTL